jgi:hypothetical protein
MTTRVLAMIVLSLLFVMMCGLCLGEVNLYMFLLFVYIHVCICTSPQSGNGFPSPYTVIVLYHMN